MQIGKNVVRYSCKLFQLHPSSVKFTLFSLKYFANDRYHVICMFVFQTKKMTPNFSCTPL